MQRIDESDRHRMDRITTGLKTKSDQIRRLAAAGFQTADIARYMGIRYQHAYNVLKAPERKSYGAESGMTIASRDAAAPSGDWHESEDQWIWTTVGKGGRIDVPTAFLAAMGVREGDPIQLIVEGDGIRVLSRDAVIRDLQAYVRSHIPDDVSLVDELLEERRAEAAREGEVSGE